MLASNSNKTEFNNVLALLEFTLVRCLDVAVVATLHATSAVAPRRSVTLLPL